MNGVTKLALVLAALVFVPALIAGGGFILPAVIAVTLLLLLVGGQFARDLIINRHMGAKSGGNADINDLLSGGREYDDGGKDR
jgi:hypothetical protein